MNFEIRKTCFEYFLKAASVSQEVKRKKMKPPKKTERDSEPALWWTSYDWNSYFLCLVHRVELVDSEVPSVIEPPNSMVLTGTPPPSKEPPA